MRHRTVIDVAEQRPSPPVPCPLFPVEDIDRFRRRWEAMAATFDADPAGSLAEADALVADMIRTLAEDLADGRDRMDDRRRRRVRVDEEDLRAAFERYGSVVRRLTDC
jgi:hypothetical protein